MPLERLAILSDVHGNLTALEAVLDDIAGRGVDRVLNLGDNVGKGPRGSAAFERLLDVCEVNVRGNWDDFIGRVGDDEPEELVWWRDELTARQREDLCRLPLSHDLVLGGRRVRLFHASAESPHVRVPYDHSPDQFEGMFRRTEMTGDGPEPTVVAYGDIHDAYLETTRGRTLVNVGSVGNALDEPTACYVVLEGEADAEPGEAAAFDIRFVRVPYDVEGEVAVAERLGMPARDVWAVELRTAIYRGLQ